MSITYEEALGIPATTEITTENAQLTPHPPTRVDLLIEVMDEITYLKEVRQQVTDGTRQADKTLTAEMYTTQIILSAYKIALDAQKEAAKILLMQNNLTQNNLTLNTDGLSEAEQNAVIQAGRILIKKGSSPTQPSSLH